MGYIPILLLFILLELDKRVVEGHFKEVIRATIMDTAIRRGCLLGHVLTEVPCTLELIGRHPILGIRQSNMIGVSVLKFNLAEAELLAIFLR